MYKTVRGSKTRGQTFKGRGETFNRKLRGTIFTLRVVDIWNKLPKEVVEAGTLTPFKRHLHSYMDMKGLKEYVQNVGKLY